MINATTSRTRQNTEKDKTYPANCSQRIQLQKNKMLLLILQLTIQPLTPKSFRLTWRNRMKCENGDNQSPESNINFARFA